MNTDPNIALQLHEVALAIGKLVVWVGLLAFVPVVKTFVPDTSEIEKQLKEINNAIRYGYGKVK
jgi:hypothetical protein